MCVRWGADQVVVGMGMNLLALGLTGVFYRAMFGFTGAAFTVKTFAPLPLPWLKDWPLLGPALFRNNWLVYLAAALAPASAWFLFHTRRGLEIRAAGEDPLAADAAGVDVRRLRTVTTLFGGVMAGTAGAYLSVAHSFNFTPGMSAGRGFIALAIVIFGRWRPGGALAAALLFGAAEGLQFHLQALSLRAPYQLWLVLPYALTVLALAARGRAVQGPAALARPYPEDS